MMETIYTDENFIVINKPSGLSIHGGGGVRGVTLVDLLLKQFPEIKNVGDDSSVRPAHSRAVGESRSFPRNERPGIVHRLDKDTSGIMVVARNQKSFEILKELFKTRNVEKTYYAIVCGALRQKEGIIEFPIGRMLKNHAKRGVAAAHGGIKGAREARTDFRVIKTSKEYSLVELKPKTGRMHQLRVHLKALGHPVACDTLYGGKNVCCPAFAGRSRCPIRRNSYGGRVGERRPEGAGRQLLHAQSLSFSFPQGKKFHFEAEPPFDFRVALDSLF